MISPFTPPGAEIVCIDATPGDYAPMLQLPIKCGSIYTVYQMHKGLCGHVVVELAEVPLRRVWHPIFGGLVLGFGLRRFRPLEIPHCLTELLTREPVKEDA